MNEESTKQTAQSSEKKTRVTAESLKELLSRVNNLRCLAIWSVLSMSHFSQRKRRRRSMKYTKEHMYAPQCCWENVKAALCVHGCFTASGPGQHAVINGNMNSQVYQDILQDNVIVALMLRRKITLDAEVKMQNEKTVFSSGPVRSPSRS